MHRLFITSVLVTASILTSLTCSIQGQPAQAAPIAQPKAAIPQNSEVGKPRDDETCLNNWLLHCMSVWLQALFGSTPEADALPPHIATLIAAPARHPIQSDVFYFVMPDRFANGNVNNDTGGISGNRLQHGFDPSDKGFFHGGDLAGLTSKLNYLDNLGITAIWMTPVFKNNPVQGSGSNASAAYHGYWYTDMTQFDPHFGTNQELETLIAEAHSRDIKIFFDIITNHTADILTYQEGNFTYRNKANYPYTDAAGNEFDDRAFDDRVFDVREFAASTGFPILDAETSFPYTPVFRKAADATRKVPAWLNNPIYYHNRGDTTFSGEDSLYGDFFGLDDLFTEHPDVVSGMIDIYKDWITKYDIDGFRIDTVKHVNLEFWQQFVPEILEHAKEKGREDFFIFGEVFSGNEVLLSHYTSRAEFPAVLDFKLQETIRGYVSGGAASNTLQTLFASDDYYTDSDSNVYRLPTFLGNHDKGRFAHFLAVDNGRLPDNEMVARINLAHAILFFARGVPVIYYGDEQGFVGDGNDKDARQDMFPSQVPSYNDDNLVGTAATTADDNFDTAHPLYQEFSQMAQLYRAHPALQTGAQIHRLGKEQAGIYAFSRIDREEQVEYIVVLNNSGEAKSSTIPTFYSAEALFTPIAQAGMKANASTSGSTSSETEAASMPSVMTGIDGGLSVSALPYGYTIYQADGSVPARINPTPTGAPTIEFTTPANGQQITLQTRSVEGNEVQQRIELAVNLGGSQFAEVTFAARVNSRQDAGKYSPIGVDDSPPYRVFYDASGVPAEATVDFVAIVNDLNGNHNYAEVVGITPIADSGAAAGSGYVAIHYLRSDNDYGDHQNDDGTSADSTDFWGLHLWGNAIDGSEVTEWSAPKPFRGETDYGRMALIKLRDDSQDVNFIVHRGDTKDGTEQDRKFSPTVHGREIWLKQGEGGFYTSQAEAQGFVTIYYRRPKGDYGSSANDTNWGLHLWGDAIADGTTTEDIATEWPERLPFDGIDNFGAFWEVPIKDASQPVNFIIHKGGEKDPGPDQSMIPLESAVVWIVSGDETIYTQEGAAANIVTIHYQRANDDYGDPAGNDFNNFWGLHTWQAAVDPGWAAPRKPTGEDAFGIFYDIPLFDGATELGYIHHRGDTKDPGPDQFLNVAKHGYEVWQFEGADPVNPFAYPVLGR